MKNSAYMFVAFSILISGCGSGGASSYGSSASSGLATARNASTLGTSSGHLVDANGYTLYESASSCTGSCLTVWPPLLAAQDPAVTGGASAASVGLQSGQVTYKGQLLYYFESDTAPGETSGSGVGGFTLVSP